MGFNYRIKIKANEFYKIISKGEIYRGGSRKGIFFACIYYAYEKQGKWQNPEKLKSIFQITNKQSLKGFKIVTQEIKYKENSETNYILNYWIEKFSFNEEKMLNLY